MTPLDEFIARWQLKMPVPFVDSINTPVETDQLPPQWGSAVLNSANRADVTFGSAPHVEESGEIIVGLFARSGLGRSVLNPAVAALRTHFHGYQSADYQLQFHAVVGPEAMDPMADGEWWRLAFTVPFIFWSQRVEPVV